MYVEAPAGPRPGWFNVVFFLCFLAFAAFVVYRDLTRPAAAAAAAPAPDAPAPEKEKAKPDGAPPPRPAVPHSVAVVPFAYSVLPNHRGDPYEQATLSGLTTALMKQEGLSVTPLSVSSALRPKEGKPATGVSMPGIPAAEAGRKLGAAYVLTGTADFGNVTQARFELIRVADGALVWSNEAWFQDETFQQAQAFERIAVEVRGKILTR
jgi:TolB-like protein